MSPLDVFMLRMSGRIDARVARNVGNCTTGIFLGCRRIHVSPSFVVANTHQLAYFASCMFLFSNIVYENLLNLMRFPTFLTNILLRAYFSSEMAIDSDLQKYILSVVLLRSHASPPMSSIEP